VKQVRKKAPAERFWKKVSVKSKDECWEWKACKLKTGYGCFIADGCRLAHRYAYLLLTGPIPAGKHIHHKCNNKSCVNPAHLEAVTPEEHINKLPREAYQEFGRKGGLRGTREQKRKASAAAAAVRVIRARKITHAGKKLSIPDWATLTGIPKVTIWKRLKRGWSEASALTR